MSEEKIPAADAFREKLKDDHVVSTFARLGAELLKEDENPNVITLDQFEPYISLFQVDQEKLKTDKEYERHLRKLTEQYRINLGINFYQPTIVILSKEDPQEL